jgi:hypothetical protein
VRERGEAAAPEVFLVDEAGGLREWMATVALLNAHGLCSAEFVDDDGKQLEAEVLAANEDWQPGKIVRLPEGRSWSDRSWVDRPTMPMAAPLVMTVRPQTRPRQRRPSACRRTPARKASDPIPPARLAAGRPDASLGLVGADQRRSSSAIAEVVA